MSDPKHSNPNPQPKPNKPEDNNLGFCADGLYLQGRAPGCRLRRELSADTLSHILHEDNLLWLGIPLAPHRASKRDPQSNVQALQKKLSDLTIPASAPPAVRYTPAKGSGYGYGYGPSAAKGGGSGKP